MVVGYLALDTSRAIGKYLIMTAITSSPPLGADPLDCHICIYKKRNHTKRNKTNAYASAQRNKFPNWPVPYEQPYGAFGAQGNSTSTWLVTGGSKNTCRHHLYWAEIHRKGSNVKPSWKNIQSHSSESNNHRGFPWPSWWKSLNNSRAFTRFSAGSHLVRTYL